MNGTKILNIFNPNGEGVLLEQYGVGERNKESLQSSFRGDDFGSSLGVTQSDRDNSNDIVNRGVVDDTAVDASGTLHERCFFHILMILVACYAAMVLTKWGRSNGAPEETSMAEGLNTGSESLWLKIVAQWVCGILYFKVLHVAYIDNLNTTS